MTSVNPVSAVAVEPESQPGCGKDPAPGHLSCVQDFDEARCKALMRVLTSIVWVADVDGSFTAPQASWSAYTGQTWAEQAGFGWMDAIHPDDVAVLRECYVRARESKAPFLSSGRLWHAGTGAYRYFEARGVPIVDGRGEIREWVGTCKDVEEQRRAEVVLREAGRRKDEFIAVLAHELRNPLAPIRTAAQVLRLRGDDDMQLTWARGIIERQVQHMARLLDDLLDVSRIGQQKLELNVSRVTLDAVLNAAIEVSRPQWEQRGQKFDLNALSGPIYLNADAPRLTQAFSNLLNNAAKYTDRGGRICLSVGVDGHHVVVSIRDNGVGISAEMLPRVFDLFSQDSLARHRSQGGLGIGLSVVREVVQKHGGTVQAFSEGLGRGSLFVVRLPAEGRARAPAMRPAHGGLRIVVADDNHDAAETMSVLLEMLGHEVRAAYDGEEAVELTRNFHPHIAFIDLGMPKRDGFAVARELHATTPGTMLVAVSGWARSDDTRRAIEAGFRHHLVKPVESDKLQAILTTAAALAEAHP